jgi:tRNA-modifying protein YgfZ
MYTQWNLLPLQHLGALCARGGDVVPFLQGQLSADVARLGAGQSLLAGYHNPQGRVLALLNLIELEPGEVLLVLPRELAQPMRKRLAGFILRSKVELADATSAFNFHGLVEVGAGAQSAPPFALHLPLAAHHVARLGDTRAVSLGGSARRWLLATPAASRPGAPGLGLDRCQPAAPELWQRLAVEAGEPQVYAATSGEFVAQMLNLDALGAIAFDKGCYTGQEVIARAHYRGRVKRRLQRFRAAAAGLPAPGDSGVLGDGRAFRVVEAVRAADGGCEFLAVAPLVAGAIGEESPPAATLRIEATQLPLPYELPE